MTTPRRYYFRIAEANVCECIHARSFREAKEIAAQTWLPWWNQLEWLESITDVPAR